MIVPDNLYNHLMATYFPESPWTLADLKVKTHIHLEGRQCDIELIAGFPIADKITIWSDALSQSLQQQFPTLTFNLKLRHFIQAHRTQLAGKGLRGVKNTIAIASGKGGVGKSTVTINLAAALAKSGARVGVLDADIYGPSIPMMLGNAAPVSIEGERYRPAQAHGLQAMSIAYLTDPEQTLIWRGPMLAKSLLQMIDLTAWDDLDYLLIDLPPGTGDIQLSLVQKIPLTAAIVVTTPQNVATLDAQKAITLFNKTNIDILGLVENMSLHTCSACGHQDSIFGEGGATRLCEQFNIPLLGQLPLHSSIRQHADEGTPIVALNNAISDPWIAMATKAAQLLAQKPINYADKFPPIVHE
jgi:ATP-binding protein involved in chromosome partitioning